MAMTNSELKCSFFVHFCYNYHGKKYKFRINDTINMVLKTVVRDDKGSEVHPCTGTKSLHRPYGP